MIRAILIAAFLLQASSLFAEPATRPAKPRLGVKLMPAEQPGVLIAEVMVGYAAESSGLVPGDRVVKVGGADIGDLDDFRAAVSELVDGSTTPFTIDRAGKMQTVTVRMSPPRPDAPGANPPTMPQLRNELVQMMEKDQAPRRIIMQQNPPREQMDQIADELAAIDAANRERLKQIIASHGFPTITMVGDDGAEAAFLFVQHGDRDPDWQKQMLPVLTDLASKGEASKSSVAYLTDRVLRAQNKPQLYGTQFYQEAGADGTPVYVAPVVEDPANLDRRRVAMGLGPWAQYEAQMARMQGREPFPAPRAPGEK